MAPKIFSYTLLVLAYQLDLVSAFVRPGCINTKICQPPRQVSSLSLGLVPANELLQSTSATTILSSPTSSSIVLAEESWRQYVPLAVSLLVIVDILLGSPVANSVLGVMRAPPEDDAADEKAPIAVKTKGERIDSSEVANEALEKARNALEWQEYKETTKTDTDRMEEMRRKMDNQLRAMDEKNED
ncbi:expressed unknown protein [Seminavis robusta]|uniref:Uncharacterized protein n=1 Tax=Seminavis robusta TaxID=568900 RepID=A0A9N8E9L9_9STRA|nr:expressed unknown protein [Seminavis robusta]|eukprot:Sro847_g210360.1 n/a (186) ;mRNA; r:38852-39409